MKRQHVFLVGLFSFLMASSFAQLKIDIPHFASLYNQGKYKAVFDEAYALRNNKEYGKMAVLDYFMAKALCGEGNYDAASKGFKYILSEYPLSKDQKKFLLGEYESCQRAEVASISERTFLAANFKMINAPNVPIARVSGKLGYILDCKTDSEAYKFAPGFNREDLQDRLFPVAQKEKAVAYYKQFLGKGYNVNTSGRFIFVTQVPYKLTTNQVNKTAGSLENAYTFLHHYYKVRPPDKLIAVYLMRDKATLNKTAKMVHGLTLPESNIGYSSLGDLSILGNSDAENIGTIYHELFHLMVRTDVGDIPAWLDEGIASLYETSNWNKGILKGNIQNWRTKVLNELLKTRRQLPQLSNIINDNWEGFTMEYNNSPCDIAINYAVAKHFAIYLQEHDLLQKMVVAFRDRTNVFTDTLSKNESSLALVEKVAGNPIAKLQVSFDEWFNRTYNIKITYSSQEVRSQFQHVYEMLTIYQNSNSKALLNSGNYRQLMDLYEEINMELINAISKGNAEMNAVVQTSLDLPIPELLNKKIKKFVDKANAFMKAHPLQ